MIDIVKYQTKLSEKKVQLEKELSELGIQDSENKNNWEETIDSEDYDTAEEGELAVQLEDEVDKRAVLESLEVELRGINKALERIKNNEFGLCRVCGKEIEEDRLELEPEADTCKEHLNA